MRIQCFEESDVAALTAFMCHWGPEAENLSSEDILMQIRHCRDHVSGEIFIARDDAGEIVAYLQMIEASLVGFPPTAEIAALLVHTDLRGQGIGTELIHFAEKWTASRGLNRLLLSSQMHRTRAHGFYERCGFNKWKQSAFFIKAVIS